MATKATVMNDEQQGGLQRLGGNVTGTWGKLTNFLGDVRSEMRKVVTPNRKEVESTTTVVIVAVFIFGLFFFLVDAFFSRLVEQILHRLGAQ
ncbi:MAG TPA: preprotein translocase subunit SecE [Terracidiphilus sp.]|nr:preprotein translocase subunit SecE [Terracidiphilus sp.]